MTSRLSQFIKEPHVENGVSTSVYTPPAVGYDEMVDHVGKTRPHWDQFLHALGELGSVELTRRWRDAQNMIRENGVTYNVFGDPQGLKRPWQLDPIPLLIPPHEALSIEKGLIQRAVLFELILADLYGPQRLIKEGHLPASLLFANPAYLRSCHDLTPAHNRYLHLYGVNLGRHTDGHWRVLGDRVQSPSGDGYALENRIVMSRTLPEAFHDCKVQRLATFFRALRQTMASIAPRNRDNPRIVLLTPGPFNESYFEHAYLARYLGYTLVEGNDLTVRDNRVYLKVLGGLQPVDVIFRRLDDDYCDPLELHPDSFQGVPGLVRAVRAGHVSVANALGTGILESPAFLGYIPKLCRLLLKEDLFLPSVTAWWCGEHGNLQHVLSRLDDMVIKPAFPGSQLTPILPGELAAADRAQLITRLQAKPFAFLAVERQNLSSVPVLSGERLESRHVVLRTYLTPTADSFMVMPGGLTWVGSTPESMHISVQRGVGGSKDTWIQVTGEVNQLTLLPAAGIPVELSRAGGDLPSRSADNLFWVGRYSERASGRVRLIRTIASRLCEQSGLRDAPEIPTLFRALYPPEVVPPVIKNPEDELSNAVFDPAHGECLVAMIRSLREAVGRVRDLISLDMWRIANSLRDFPETDDAKKSWTTFDILAALNRTIITLSAMGGQALESMTRSVGWRFLVIGRSLERTYYSVNLLERSLGQAVENDAPILDAVLEVADSRMTYRRRYYGSLRTEAVLDLLISDESNPSSLAAQLLRLDDNVNNLPRSNRSVGGSPEQRLARSALYAVRLAEAEKLAEARENQRPGLLALCEHLRTTLPALSDLLTQQYLSHLQTSRHLSGGPQGRLQS